MYKFYLLDSDINEATSYYLNIIQRGLQKQGENVSCVHSLSQIQRDDKVIVIHAKAFLRVWLKNPKQYIVIWFQGVVPEEAMCLFENNASKYLRKYFWTFLEYFSLRKAAKIFFISHAMLVHYQKKYAYKKKNYFIMPCYNQELDLSVITPEKYELPSFVYAGSLSRWQCITEMLQLFRKIKDIIPQATLALYTKDKEMAMHLCKQNGIEAKIDFVPTSQLQNALKQYKYGLIVRDDIVVNNVATPTKMNSYIAAGIIPVYSDVIYDFRDVFGKLKYSIPFLKDEECISKLIRIEKEKVAIDSIKTEYKDIFESYYSTAYYINQIGQFLVMRN